MFIFQQLYLISYFFLWFLQNQPNYISLVETLHVPRNSQSLGFKIINLPSSGEEQGEDGNFNNIYNNEIVPNYLTIRNEHKTEVYAKALLAGVKNNKKNII